ncbi:MAG: PQQ-dependent sugar dehydrogenase [Pirellulaceae bacterium]|nr:PQQ-dependent sugar dehydrogenase [Pirellulaceae bacterium]
MSRTFQLSIGLSLQCLLALIFIVAVRAEAPEVDRALPHWIWASEESFSSEASLASDSFVRFESSIDVTIPIRMAKLKIAADFCHVRVILNQRLLAEIEPYCETIELDATDAMRLGKNTFQIEAMKRAGPTAIAASLTYGVADQQQLHSLVTDDNWEYVLDSKRAKPTPAKKAISSGKVTPELWGIGRRSTQVDATENYEQWRQATSGTSVAGNSFWTVPGFEVSLVRQANEEEGSWVSMAFDPKGRLTIAREEKGLLRMTLDESMQSVAQVEVVNNELLECRGLLFAYDSLYASANKSKGLYRLRDTDGDDAYDDVQLLREFPGGTGHGRNDLALGPDGWIYAIHGDSVEVPSSDFIDRTSPFRDLLRGKSVGQGHVIRTDPDGKRWEILASGMRNPFGIAVNPDGDWFTYDADAEFDMGTPWYRPTRVVQLRSGADYGWRSVTGKWPPYFADHPDNAMPTLDIGKGSPTAVMFATDANFPEAYRRCLLILDWTYGRILAVHLSPRGAGYRANAETFLQGRPLNVTDLAVGPDGALYIITGGRKTQSALYRIAYTGAIEPHPLPTLHEQQCAEHSTQSKGIRSQLEKMHVPGNELTTDFMDLAWLHLDSDDWGLRQSARVAIEHQPLSQWLENALSESRTTASLEACSALVRSGEASVVSRVIERLLGYDPKSLSLSQNWMLVQCYQLLEASSPNKLDDRKLEIIGQTDSIFQSVLPSGTSIGRSGTSHQLLGACASLLATRGSPTIVPEVSRTLLASSVQEQRLHGLLALRNVRTGWTKETRELYFRTLQEGASFLRGEGMQKFLSQLRSDAIETLSESERLELAGLLEPKAVVVEAFDPTRLRPTVQKWSMQDLLPVLSEASFKPDKVRGAAIFGDAMCNRCHRAGAVGPAVGPDLTHIANRFSKKDILQSIVEPSLVIAENYRKVQVSTTDGRVLVGRMLIEGDYRSQKIQLATDSLNSAETIEIDKSDIESIKESPVSPMPEGLLDGFQISEILDLLAFLVNAEGS